MENIRNVTATGAPRCRGRVCGEAVREAGKPIYYRPEQCKRACAEGTNLCTFCLKHEANVKGLKWHGRVGNTVPNVSHIEGSKWYRTKVLGAVDEAATAAKAAEKAAEAAAKAGAKEEAKAARMAATAAKAAEREAVAAAKAAAKAEKAVASEAAKLAREAEKARREETAALARAEREAAKEKKAAAAAVSDETAAHRAAAALFARVNRNRNALYRTAAAASRKAATEARKANAAAKRATSKRGRKASSGRKTSSNRARNNRGRFTARRNNSIYRPASASPERVVRSRGYATPYSGSPVKEAPAAAPALPGSTAALPAAGVAPLARQQAMTPPRSASVNSFNEAAAMNNLMGLALE